MSAFDAIVDFLLGSPPEGLEAINYTFRCVIGILFFDVLLDVFRMIKFFTLGRR